MTDTQHRDAAIHLYDMPIKENDEASCVAWLIRLYQEEVSEER